MISKKRKYFSIILLISFLASFGFNSYNNCLFSSNKEVVNYSKNVLSSNHISNDATQINNVCEETENDLGDTFSIVSYLLPNIISFSHFADIHSSQIFAQPLAENHNPIYLSVCNFRI